MKIKKNLKHFMTIPEIADMVLSSSGNIDIVIAGVSSHGDDTTAGMVFCAIDEYLEYGNWVRGDLLIDSAIKSGAVALLSNHQHTSTIPQLIVNDARKATAVMAKWYHDKPDESMLTVGVTGTNGKTTTTHFIYQLLHAAGRHSAVQGTVGVYKDGKNIQSGVYTTPLSTDLFSGLAQMQALGTEVVALEVSSHAIKLDRVFGLDLDVGVFTNLSRDHIDFHGSFADYRDTKLALFQKLRPTALAVINSDDPLANMFVAACKCRCVLYGTNAHADVRATEVQLHQDKIEFVLHYKGERQKLHVPVVGLFNLSNILATIATALGLGVDFNKLPILLESIKNVPGRLEYISLPDNRVGIVDFAHTPDALEKILTTVKNVYPTSRIITVFGCGGDRDKGKRPQMGQIAERYSDICILTSDNPRTEDPQSIIDDILRGMDRHNCMVEVDRKTAISQAWAMSAPGDVILLAGKGHESYQIVGQEKLAFNDREELNGLIVGTP